MMLHVIMTLCQAGVACVCACVNGTTVAEQCLEHTHRHPLECRVGLRFHWMHVRSRTAALERLLCRQTEHGKDRLAGVAELTRSGSN